MADVGSTVGWGATVRERAATATQRLRGIQRDDVRRLVDRAYEKMATELNCCGCYVGCVTVPVIAISTGILVATVIA